MNPRPFSVLAFGLASACAHGDDRAPETLDLSRVPQSHELRPGLWTAGQPTADDLRTLADAGLEAVVNLRTDGEPGTVDDEAEILRSRGVAYLHIPIAGPEDLTRENAAQLDAFLEAHAGQPTLVHCGSSNRVGALLALRARYFEGESEEEALALGDEAGLKKLRPAVEAKLDEASP